MTSLLKISKFHSIGHNHVLDAYSYLIANSLQPEEHIFALAQYGMDNVPVNQVTPYICLCFDNYDTWHEPERIGKVFKWICQNIEDSEVFKKKVIDRSMDFSESNIPLFLEYESILSNLDLMTKKTLWKSIKIHSNRHDFEKVKWAWNKRASLLTSIKEAETFLKLCSDLFSKAPINLFLKRILQDGVQNGFPRDLAFGVESELKIFYALNMFEGKKDSKEYIDIVEDHYEAHPDDTSADMNLNCTWENVTILDPVK